ncbi:MAG: alpha/beta fold hydrolase [Actinomycetota bacterium]
MRATWTRWTRLLTLGVVTALIAVGCGSGSDGGAAVAETAEPTATVVEVEATGPEPTSTAEPTASPEPTAPAEPTPSPEPTAAAEPTPTPEPPPTPEPEPEDPVVDIATFEQFPLPAYVAAQLGEGFSSYFVEFEPGVKVHVLEAGSGYPVYLQHGAPTSGLLYRKVAAELPLDEYRLIMPTMIGLGFSGDVDPAEHTLENHARWMQLTLEQLGIDELIYVGHDWGGPVGMGALTRAPELMAGAVLLNTSLVAPTEPIEFNPALAQLLSQPPGSEAALNVAIFAQLPAAQNDVDSLAPDVLDLYRRPVVEGDDPPDRAGVDLPHVGRRPGPSDLRRSPGDRGLHRPTRGAGGDRVGHEGPDPGRPPRRHDHAVPRRPGDPDRRRPLPAGGRRRPRADRGRDPAGQGRNRGVGTAGPRTSSHRCDRNGARPVACR